MSTPNAKSLDQILRAKARKELEDETRKEVEGVLRRHFGDEGKYRHIWLKHDDLVVVDNGPEALEEDRYAVRIPVSALAAVLIADAMALHGPKAEQTAVTEFLERVESLGEEIDELRQAQREG
jgi:hypothetical protein